MNQHTKIIIAVIVVLAVIAAIVAYAMRRDDGYVAPPRTTTTTTPGIIPTPTTTPPATTTPPIKTQTVRERVLTRSKDFLTAIKHRNIDQAISFIHPTKGVRFSLYGYVDSAKDKVFTRAQIKQYYNTNVKFTWGAQEGSGTPIVMSLKDFIAQYTYNHDFAAAPQVNYDTYEGASSTLNNVKEKYPNSHIVQFRFPAFDPQYGGLDWQAIRIVMEEYRGEWYVVGIVKDEWTP